MWQLLDFLEKSIAVILSESAGIDAKKVAMYDISTIVHRKSFGICKS